jgi:peptidoglycan/xylan/chitin deacetylase (PgdA/CDA1 family)
MTRRFRPQGDLILCLHNVVTRHGPLGVNRGLDLTADELEGVLACLDEEGYRPAALDEIWHERGTAEKRFAITFDDGYAGNLHVAYPLLRRRAIPFTVYVTTGFMDHEVHVWWYALERLIGTERFLGFEHAGRAYRYATLSPAQKVRAYQRIRGLLLSVQPEIATGILQQLFAGSVRHLAEIGASDVLSADQVRALSRDPLVTIGAHSMSHPALRQLDDEACRREICGSGERLAAVTGKPVAHFAYPFGNRAAYGPREERLVQESGYETAATTRARQLQITDRPTALPRLMLTAELDVRTGLRALLSGWLGSRD